MDAFSFENAMGIVAFLPPVHRETMRLIMKTQMFGYAIQRFENASV